MDLNMRVRRTVGRGQDGWRPSSSVVVCGGIQEGIFVGGDVERHAGKRLGEGGIEGAVHSLEDMLINNKWLVDESSGCGNTVSRSF